MSLPRVNGTTFEDVKDSLHRYLEDVASSQPLSSKEEVSLARRIKKGDMEARAKLVEANLRFVITVAREYQNQGVPLVDLISAGNVGLITA
ncbi:MAG TPA: RNA polymerase subunit sigma, partial [Candidatus Latescibacteria bacterium]|nr:RNA polymerase subunit sigma [Candidatus Latescibacterota bacterium]